MTKEQYLAEKGRLNDAIVLLYSELDKNEADYIQEHSQFQVGDKVMLITDSRQHPFQKDKIMEAFSTPAYIKKVKENYGLILYDFYKCKANGSQSLNQLYQRSYDRIELIEKAKAPKP